MEVLSVDVCIIGSGPAGQKAAIQAAKLGKSVIVIEKAPEPGGQCLYSGTIPSWVIFNVVMDYMLSPKNYSSFQKEWKTSIDYRQIKVW